MGKVIAIVNEKGGVAKTTTAKNLSAGAALKGLKVLAVDLDPAAGLTMGLGLGEDGGPGAICGILRRTINGEEIPDGYGIARSEEGFDAITSSKELRGAEAELANAFRKEDMIAQYAESVRDKYDLIFLDCPAGIGIFTANALFAADSLVIPVEPSMLDLTAMNNLLLAINSARRARRSANAPKVSGVVFTSVRAGTKNDRQVMAQMRGMCDEMKIRIFDTTIPLSSKIKESDLARRSVFRHEPNCTAAFAYMDLTEEFLAAEGIEPPKADEAAGEGLA